MLTSEARIPTTRASRYLAQLCKHTGQLGQLGQLGHRMRHRPQGHGDGDGHRDGHGAASGPPNVQRAEWSDTEGTIDFGQGRCSLRATADALVLRVEADDPRQLQRIQAGIARRLERIGRRDELVVMWGQAPPETPVSQPAE